MPPDAFRTLVDVSEVINTLWGHDTPGRRLFPSPLERRTRAVALAPDRSQATEMRIDQARGDGDEQRAWQWYVFPAVDDERLVEIGAEGLTLAHRPGFETTVFPCALLWQGAWEDLVRGLDTGAIEPAVDSIQHLDRLFFVRADGGTIDPARCAADVLALDPVPAGRRYALTADSPIDAWVHVRDHELDREPQTSKITSRSVDVIGLCPER